MSDYTGDSENCSQHAYQVRSASRGLQDLMYIWLVIEVHIVTVTLDLRL